MKAEDLFEAIGRGIVKQLLAPEAAVSPAAMFPAENGPPEGVVSPPEAPSIIPGDLPTPSFDQVEGQLPLIPPATLKQMQDAVERIQRGNGVPPGFYDKDDADTSVPLS